MAASAADVRSALSIAGPSNTNRSQQVKKQPSQTTKKPEGISRELYSLIGPSAPSLAAQLAKPRLKQKPNLGGGGKVKWEWRPFKNGARSDSLQLGHWVKATTEPESEYPFAKYNVQATHYTWSQDEYARHLEDKDWTKEETEYLFNLAKEYDLRWFVIFDRYDYPRGEKESPRAIEDLKERYFSVCRKLARNRTWADENAKNHLVNSMQYDKDREQMRKLYLTSLDNRTPEQLAEEEALFIEIKRLEQNERKFKREREELLRVIAGVESGLPDVADDDPTISLSLDPKKRRKGMDLDVPPTPILTAPVMKRPQTYKTAAYDAQHCIIRNEPSSTTPATKAAHTPSYMRSYKLPVPKAAIAPRVTQTLGELGIQHTRLVMPTKENCALLESLLEATTALVETKKVVDKVEYDIKVLKSQLDSREQDDAENDNGDGAASVGDAMELDDGELVETQKNGRGESVASARSTRSRKPSRRSMSISSVDTSVNLGNRATKRQKRS
ncbi:swr complex subunit [Marasmius crinis-equi]|uniref:SWR1-complex protein 4 n=1 Tax=Marasmius crinis-equi TaxID=585013 RepID=A0ABR3F4P2_9AGAR